MSLLADRVRPVFLRLFGAGVESADGSQEAPRKGYFSLPSTMAGRTSKRLAELELDPHALGAGGPPVRAWAPRLFR
jgi:hypothetical protein